MALSADERALLGWCSRPRRVAFPGLRRESGAPRNRSPAVDSLFVGRFDKLPHSPDVVRHPVPTRSLSPDTKSPLPSCCGQRMGWAVLRSNEIVQQWPGESPGDDTFPCSRAAFWRGSAIKFPNPPCGRVSWTGARTLESSQDFLQTTRFEESVHSPLSPHGNRTLNWSKP